MKCKKRKMRVLLAALIALSLSTGFSVSESHVASAAPAGAVQLEKAAGDNAVSFTDRIQRILDEYKVINKPNTRFLPKDNEHAASSHVLTDEERAAKQAADEMLRADTNTPAQNKAARSESQQINHEAKYDFVWKGTPLSQSLFALGSAANKGIIVNGELTGTVYMSLKQVTCTTALDYLSRAYGFNWMVEGNNIIVSTKTEMLQSSVFDVDYADKDKLKEEIKALGIDEKYIYNNSETGTISVTATPYQLQQAKKRLNILDKPIAQCLLVAQLIEIDHGDTLDLGFSYSLPTYQHTATSSGRTTDSSFRGNWLEKLTFSVNAQANKSLSKGKVISRPMVLTKNGEKSSIVFGDRVPIFKSTTSTSSTEVTVEYEQVGTTLEIQPIINKNNEVSMNIHGVISNISGYETMGNTKAPQISNREISTAARVHSGQSLVIGGLMSETDMDALSGIPGLMNLPIIGELFKFHSKSKSYAEVFIMITPYIVDDSIDPKDILRQVQ